MLERFLTLFEKPVGYVLLFGFCLILFCIKKYNIKDKRHRGYFEVTDKDTKKVVYFGVIGFFVMAIFFTIMYSLDFRDVDNKTLDGHIMLMLGIMFAGIYLYLYICYEKIYFNETEIIVYGFLKKTKKYYFEDIVKIVNISGYKRVIVTYKGKFSVGYGFHNEQKLVKILQTKNIKTENLNMLGKLIE